MAKRKIRLYKPSSLWWAALWFVFAALFATMFYRGVTSDSLHRDVEYVPWTHSVQQATEVASLENDNITFLQVNGFLTSTTYSDNSHSAPQVNASSPEQFVQLVPEDATVYSDITTSNCTDSNSNEYVCIVEENYYAFIENTAGLVKYSDVYGIKDYEATAWSDTRIKFEKRTFDSRVPMQIFGLIGTIIFGAITIGMVFDAFNKVGASKKSRY